MRLEIIAPALCALVLASGCGEEGAGDGCPPKGYGMHTVDELLAESTGFDGDRVAFEAVIDVGFASCTAQECDPADPCCNDCHANYEVVDLFGQIQIVGGGVPQVGCSGTECDVEDRCEPLPEIPATYVVWGTWEAFGSAVRSLYLDGWCLVE